MASEATVGPRLGARRPHSRAALIAWMATALLVLAGSVAAGLVIGTTVRSSRTHPASVLPATARHSGLDGQATWAAAARPAPPITALSDQSGHRFSLAALHGHTVALVFFDSHCRQQCPLEGRALAQAERALPASERPVLVAVSVNPKDTPASVRHAVRAWGLASLGSWHWLMGARARLASVWRAYHIYVGPEIQGSIEHTEAIYLIDRRGYERSAYLYPFLPRFVTHDLRRLAE